MSKKLLITIVVMGALCTLTETQASADTVDATEVKELCREFPFSSDTDPERGCLIAAALDRNMPGTVEQVAAIYKKWGPKQRNYYTDTRLPKLTRWYTFAAYYFKGATRIAMFRKNHSDYMDNASLSEFLEAPATRLDVVRAMRPKSRSHRSARVVKTNRLLAMSKKKGGGCLKACPAP